MTHSAFYGSIVFAFLLFGIVGCDDSPTDANDEPDDPGGSGDIIEISTIDELQLIGNDADYPLDGDYEIVDNIDADETAEWNDGEGFVPIGHESETFKSFDGTLDGLDHTIDGLTINQPDTRGVGLFVSTLENVEIRDLNLKNVNVVGFANVGALVGNANSTKLENITVEGSVEALSDRHAGLLAGRSDESTTNNVHVEGEVAGTGYLGGLFGTNSGYIEGSSAEVNIESESNAVGGLVGTNTGEITESFSIGSISGRARLGGITGTNRGEITESFAHVDITEGWSRIGGIVGLSFEDGILKNAYARGDIYGSRGSVGGAVGKSDRDAEGSGEITNVYVAGGVEEDDGRAGGVMGHNRGEIEVTHSYWNVEKSETESSVYEGPEGDNLEGLTSAEMQGDAAEENLSNFDFDDTWQIVSGDYPDLLWE